MNIKKVYGIVVFILLIILGIVIWSYINREEEVINKVGEIVPEEEISDEQMRNTIVSIYFINKETKEIEIETKLIDAKKLLINPYNELLNMWIMGANNNKLDNFSSKEIKINNVEVLNGCAIIDLSQEFIDGFNGEEGDELKVVYCIVNTLTELTEIDSIKILINGEENKYLGNINLSDKFYKINEN